MAVQGLHAAGLLPALRRAFLARGSVVVGFSGGVDSALLSRVAHDALGPRALAVTVDSPSLPRRELAEAEAFARAQGLRWRAVPAHEMDNPLYVANRGDRCFFCREEMSAVLRRVADREGFAHVAMGVHADDMAEDRPGHAAMRAAGVWWPLAEAGAGKEDVRAMARALGLSVAEKPAMACLSSRLPVGEAVTLDRLARVEAAEDWLRDRGFAQVRVRLQGDLARIEVGPAEVPRLQAMAGAAEAELRRLGFLRVHVDPRGYRPPPVDGPAVRGP